MDFPEVFVRMHLEVAAMNALNGGYAGVVLGVDKVSEGFSNLNSKLVHGISALNLHAIYFPALNYIRIAVYRMASRGRANLPIRWILIHAVTTCGNKIRYKEKEKTLNKTGNVKTILPQSGVAFVLKKGQKLRVIDSEGQQVADLFCADLSDPDDSLSGGRTIDYNEDITMRPGHFLYAHSGNRLLEMLTDQSPGIHDLLVTPCSLQMFQMMNKNTDFHPSCLGNLAGALKEFGIREKQVTSTFNIFMNIKVDISGKIKVVAPTSKSKDYVEFIACRDIIIGLTACSDEGTNNGSCKCVEYEIS